MKQLNTPKGTRDFSPKEMTRRNYIFDTIKSVFQRYGYLPIETPSMENLETLTGKYGEEGDRLIFKILARGRKLDDALQKNEQGKLAEEALRYDLTVPFARYVVQHQNEITFPFKRYQIQPVWRADRPQKGRYREFYQCDVDVIGSDSLLNEVELVQIMDEVFSALKISATIKINNRKILAGLAEVYGVEDKFTDLTVAIDKLDKIGLDKVLDELKERGFSDKSREGIASFLNMWTAELFNQEKLEKADELLSDSETGKKGLSELKKVIDSVESLGMRSAGISFDGTLARGLNYYTGAIFEVVTNDFPGSIGGGGRYDDLTGIFGLPGVSGVGVSFGADRIYDVMLEQGLFPETVTASTKVMFTNFGETEAQFCLPLVNRIRQSGISAELYPDSAKMKKQMKYADNKGIEFVVIVGEKEMESGKLSVKNMKSSEQRELSIDELITTLSEAL